MIRSNANDVYPLPALPPRHADSHKGAFGAALIVGGSRGMSGAVAMTGLAAVRAGAGLVRLAVPDRCLETVASFSPCTMTVPLPDNESGKIAAEATELLGWIEKSTCVAFGPGMGQSRDLCKLFSNLLPTISIPLVIDADGLNTLAQTQPWEAVLPGGSTSILTPHPGEWERLSGVSANAREQQIDAAITIAARNQMIVVLKGHQTLVTNGSRSIFNNTGTPAMATGGSGDVLTGVITALVCQGLTPFDAAHLGVWVHGKAAELAERDLESHVVLPTELIQWLPQAFLAAKQNC